MFAKRLFAAVAVIALVALSGCNTLSKQPQIARAGIDPQVMQPGNTGVITIEIQDRQGVVDRVEGVVLEDPRLTFKLRDDGQAPDEKAGDGVWSMQVDVPFQAPPGEFRLEFTAYGKDGMPLSVRDKEGHVIPLQQVIPLRIEYTQQQ